MATTNSSKPEAAGKNAKEKTVPMSVYLRHIQRARGAGNWFQFSRDYVISGAMTKIQALFVQDVINLAAMASTKKDEDDFFLCTVEYLETSMCWEKETQRKTINTLVEKGFLEVKRVGVPPRRWLKVCLDKIENAVDVCYGELDP